MIERTTSPVNDIFAPAKPKPSRHGDDALPVRREIEPGRSDKSEPATGEKFAEKLTAAKTEQPADDSTGGTSTAPNPTSDETPRETAEDQPDAATAVAADSSEREGTVAEWVAEFRQLTEPTTDQQKPVADPPVISAAEINVQVVTDSDVPAAELATSSVPVDVNPVGYTDVVTVPLDTIVPASDAPVGDVLTAATAISPAEFAAAQEAIQRAATQVVRETAQVTEVRAALTTATAIAAPLTTATINKRELDADPKRPTVVDQRTGPKSPTTSTVSAEPAGPVEPQPTQPTDRVSPAQLVAAEPAARLEAPIAPTGAQVRAAEATTEIRSAPTQSVPQVVTVDTTAAADLSTADAAPKPAATIKADVSTPVSREQFTAANEPNVVRSVSALVKDNGGEMKIRLDPPSLGNVAVRVKMTAGVAEVSFVTPSGDAAKALGQSLHTLKQSLEAAGVQVDRINVRQAQPTDTQSQTNSDSRGGQEDPAARDQRQNEQQRAREELARRWRNVIYGDEIEQAA
ncbi:MAG: flagellar hook-length control protein FliK [Planctomycetota bacterium]